MKNKSKVSKKTEKAKKGLLKENAVNYPDLINYLDSELGLGVSSTHTVKQVLDLIRAVENGTWTKKFKDRQDCL